MLHFQMCIADADPRASTNHLIELDNFKDQSALNTLFGGMVGFRPLDTSQLSTCFYKLLSDETNLSGWSGWPVQPPPPPQLQPHLFYILLRRFVLFLVQLRLFVKGFRNHFYIVLRLFVMDFPVTSIREGFFLLRLFVNGVSWYVYLAA